MGENLAASKSLSHSVCCFEAYLDTTKCDYHQVRLGVWGPKMAKHHFDDVSGAQLTNKMVKKNSTTLSICKKKLLRDKVPKDVLNAMAFP